MQSTAETPSDHHPTRATYIEIIEYLLSSLQKLFNEQKLAENHEDVADQLSDGGLNLDMAIYQDEAFHRVQHDGYGVNLTWVKISEEVRWFSKIRGGRKVRSTTWIRANSCSQVECLTLLAVPVLKFAVNMVKQEGTMTEHEGRLITETMRLVEDPGDNVMWLEIDDVMKLLEGDDWAMRDSDDQCSLLV